jgi:hypothetical protein
LKNVKVKRGMNKIWILLVVLIPTVTNAQDFKNLDFESPCDSLSEAYCVWTKSWGSKNCCRIDSIAPNAFLSLSGNKENAVSFIEQRCEIAALTEIKILEVSAKIRTIDVMGKGAGLNIGLYDKAGALISTRDMGGFYSQSWIKNTNDWNIYGLKIICPKGTSRINIGAILYGSGIAEFDNYTIQLVDLDNRYPSFLAKSYISQAVKIISENALVRDSIDTELLKQKALLIAGNAENHSECYLAVQYLLESLRPYGDEHSFFMTKQEANTWENNVDAEGRVAFPKVERIDDIGYIVVPPFHGGNEHLMKTYADSLQMGLKRIFSEDLEGWVVDLRENTGGNMEPMIVGLGPLLDSGKIGSLMDINGNKEHWYYRNGTYFWGEEAGITLSAPFEIKKKLPIAVLIGPQTGSSGEVVAISFVGNTNTKLFGNQTWGLTTGNGEFELEDGAKMFLASTKMVDRNGNIYTSRIKPDVEIANNKKDDRDLVLEAAYKWIKEI